MKIYQRTAAAAAALAVVLSQSAALTAAADTASLTEELANDVAYWRAYFDGKSTEGLGDEPDFVQSSFNNTTYDAGVSSLPSKFDQRDDGGVNRVPEIKTQDPFGSCWAFGVTAATEISYAYTHDIDFNTATAEQIAESDFSERALTYFVVDPLPGDFDLMSQAGEGVIATGYAELVKEEETDSEKLNNALFSLGGNEPNVISLYNSLLAPALESDVPYINDEHTYKVSVYEREFVDDEQSPGGYRKVIINGSDEDEDYITEYTLTYDEYLELLEKLEKEDAGKYDDLMADPSLYKEKGPGKYYSVDVMKSPAGTWTVDETLRRGKYEFSNISQLPGPAVVTKGDSEDSEYTYTFDSNAVDIIKGELISGHGVAIKLHAVQNYPDDPIDSSFTAFIDENGERTDNYDDAAIWATYNFMPSEENKQNYNLEDGLAVNHSVTVVGWDDDFPKEYFNDPEGKIGGNGAFIIRNSWGSKGNSDFTADSFWGNGGDGYYYVSYYDETLVDALSIEMTPESELKDGIAEKTVNKYDYVSYSYYGSIAYGNDKDLSFANVFTADSNQSLYNVGITVPYENTRSEIDVYLLDDDAKSPTDGEKVASVTENSAIAGYHAVPLETPVNVRSGHKYSIVAKCYHNDKVYVPYNHYLNENAKRTYDAESKTWDPGVYINAKVNKGESFVGLDGDWADWSEVIDSIDEKTKSIDDSCYDYDNFPLQAFAYKEVVSVYNSLIQPEENYNAGDVVKGQIIVRNNTDSTMKNVVVNNTLVDLGKDGVIDELAPNEDRVISYEYTVTAKDAANGEIISTVSVTADGSKVKLFDDLSVTTDSASTAVGVLTPPKGNSEDANKGSNEKPGSTTAGNDTVSVSSGEVNYSSENKIPTTAPRRVTKKLAEGITSRPTEIEAVPASEAAATPAATPATPAAAAAATTTTPAAADSTPVPDTGAKASVVVLALSAAAVMITRKKH